MDVYRFQLVLLNHLEAWPSRWRNVVCAVFLMFQVCHAAVVPWKTQFWKISSQLHPDSYVNAWWFADFVGSLSVEWFVGFWTFACSMFVPNAVQGITRFLSVWINSFTSMCLQCWIWETLVPPSPSWTPAWNHSNKVWKSHLADIATYFLQCRESSSQWNSVCFPIGLDTKKGGLSFQVARQAQEVQQDLKAWPQRWDARQSLGIASGKHGPWKAWRFCLDHWN